MSLSALAMLASYALAIPLGVLDLVPVPSGSSAGQAMRALAPIKGGVIVREADSRADAAAQALRDLADAGLVLGRYEEIRLEVKDA